MVVVVVVETAMEAWALIRQLIMVVLVETAMEAVLGGNRWNSRLPKWRKWNEQKQEAVAVAVMEIKLIARAPAVAVAVEVNLTLPTVLAVAVAAVDRQTPTIQQTLVEPEEPMEEVEEVDRFLALLGKH